MSERRIGFQKQKPFCCPPEKAKRMVAAFTTLYGKGPTASGHRSGSHILNVANEIANGFDLVGVVIRKLHTSKLIFDQDEQFQTIKPVGMQIVAEVGFIGYTLDIDAEMFGNKRADLADLNTITAACLLSEAQAIEGHGQPPNQLSAPHPIKERAPQCGAARKFRECCNSGTLG